MDAEGEQWRDADWAAFVHALQQVPRGRAEGLVRVAIDLFFLAGAATGGGRRVAPLGPPSSATSAAEWTEDLRQDTGEQTFFEVRVLQLRPDLLPGLADVAAEPAWAQVRAGAARLITGGRRAPELLDEARRRDAAASTRTSAPGTAAATATGSVEQ